ncbi:radical SAM family heme chaperone HemW [Endozoicomonas sp. GU-1]|uniref:radical SAM family heme chaperone HemW n=1 Tax=Endozoicomonas sp. GU-1 TaxID=3009078 RepID=UPI0022B401C9|nr:radical SAM family heme chaperone HemW [Endozoicomonas sp. GU-1]WBA81171.1 radical SAM family heme chaperone HemW [Endozoicomonas sp. GU-1]WBA88736.1 radical SAM family heme chaperone HemW [Endozoicomonas sp. GU-1]
MLKLPPLSLYIHVPWCVKKCPYCDFNSHRITGDIPEDAYIKALLHDIDNELDSVQGRPIHSIFIGGGTPSLLTANAYQQLFIGLQARVGFSDDIEITMEANPGTYEHDRFQAYLEAGVNRLSLGVQSFQDEKLAALGRIHCADEARQAIAAITSHGFSNINIDLMHGLPEQSPEDALYDLKQAIDLKPAHISWYQLTIEPNTVFYTKTPALPPDDTLWDIQEAGQALLASAGFQQYEISAYSQPGRHSKHNLNYWQFGDYIGIGAGAHGKLTHASTGLIYRNWKTRMPADYLAADSYISHAFEAGRRELEADELPIEFMMNVLRLHEGVDAQLYGERTGQTLSGIHQQLKLARQKALLEPLASRLKPTPTGRLFLNDLLELFA